MSHPPLSPVPRIFERTFPEPFLLGLPTVPRLTPSRSFVFECNSTSEPHAVDGVVISPSPRRIAPSSVQRLSPFGFAVSPFGTVVCARLSDLSRAPPRCPRSQRRRAFTGLKMLPCHAHVDWLHIPVDWPEVVNLF